MHFETKIKSEILLDCILTENKNTHNGVSPPPQGANDPALAPTHPPNMYIEGS